MSKPKFERGDKAVFNTKAPEWAKEAYGHELLTGSIMGQLILTHVVTLYHIEMLNF